MPVCKGFVWTPASGVADNASTMSSFSTSLALLFAVSKTSVSVPVSNHCSRSSSLVTVPSCRNATSFAYAIASMRPGRHSGNPTAIRLHLLRQPEKPPIGPTCLFQSSCARKHPLLASCSYLEILTGRFSKRPMDSYEHGSTGVEFSNTIWGLRFVSVSREMSMEVF